MLLLQSENAVDEEKSRSVAAKVKEFAARRAKKWHSSSFARFLAYDFVPIAKSK